MNKLEKIAFQEQKTREKIVAMQAILKQIDGQRTEQENLQIIQQVRALRLSRDELYAFISGGALPAPLVGAITGADTTAEPDGGRLPETIYTQRGRTRRHEPDTEPDAEMQSGNTETTTNFESEGMNNEE
jgi:hypothetical protein